MTQITINGNAYSDDGTASRDMRGDGAFAWMLPMLGDTMVRVTAAETAATNASASATAAADSAAALVGTSASSVAIGIGSKSLTASTGKQWAVGQYIALLDTALPTTNAMWGQVTAYNSGTGALTVAVDTTIGSGTISAWTIVVSGKAGPQGPTGGAGPAGSSLTSATLSTNTTLVAADTNKFIDITATCTITLSAPGTLGSTWWAYLRNSGAAGTVVTLAHTSGNIDGVASFKMYEGEVRLVRCNGTTVLTHVVVPFRRFCVAGTTIDMPPGYRWIDTDGIAGGSGGNSGDRQASSPSYGGTGGAGGGRFVRRLAAPAVNTTITINVGSGGAGAPARTTDGLGQPGSAGSASSVVWGGVTRAGSIGGSNSGGASSTGGGLVAGHTHGASGQPDGHSGGAATSPGAPVSADYGGGSGGPYQQTAGQHGTKGGSSLNGGPGGGAGGWVDAGVVRNGGDGGTRDSATSGGGGLGATSPGAAGGTRTDSGGGGGGGNTGGNGGAGGAGTGYGAGGGGGGGVVGAFNSGPGAAGTDGYVEIVGVV